MYSRHLNDAYVMLKVFTCIHVSKRYKHVSVKVEKRMCEPGRVSMIMAAFSRKKLIHVQLPQLNMFYSLQRYCWLKNGRGHFEKNLHVETLSHISLHYENSPCFPNEGGILKIKGHFAHGPFPKLSQFRMYTVCFLFWKMFQWTFYLV